MLTINFSPFPELQTDRLVLRRLADSDAEAIFRLRSDAENMKYIPRPLATNIEDALQHIRMINEKIEENLGINWAITSKETSKFIGIIGHYKIKPEDYRAEIGYMLLPEFHGKGYASEAIRETVGFGFSQMNLHSIEAIIDPGNTASAKVLEKNGFVKEAHLKENFCFNGEFLDTVIYSKLKSTHLF